MVKNYILGTLAFGTAVSTFLIQAFHFPPEPTIISAVAVCCFFILIVALIWLAEKNVQQQLAEHIAESNILMEKFKSDMEYIKQMSKESQCSALRIEMDNEIFRNPSNHDTIIRYAHRYFGELDADWVETEKILAWQAEEEKAGRLVHLPPDLLLNIQNKALAEKKR